MASIQRFGALLNTHVTSNVSCWTAFSKLMWKAARFHEDRGVGAEAVAVLQTKVRRRLLSALARRGRLEPKEAEGMRAGAHDGDFSLDASARIEADDQLGLERLLRCCARLGLALERLREIDTDHLVYHSAKPNSGGSLTMMLTPLKLLDRLAAVIPPPRRHRRRYFRVLVPNTPLREAVTAPMEHVT